MSDKTSRWTHGVAAWPSFSPDEIVPGLWQGGTADDQVVGYPAPADHYAFNSPFDLVVTLYADAQPAPWGVEEIRFGFYDGALSAQSAETAIRIARVVSARLARGQRVLVRCQAGVNRSGLVSALVLMLQGHEPAEAIALLRERRSPMVLCNRDFERWLLTDASDMLADAKAA